MSEQKWRILVVDDEADVRMIIRATLEPDYEILEAHDGLDALEKVERYQPDFVLMDVMMPLMNGFEACEAIRKSEDFQDLPVMFLSALGTKEDIKKGYSSGANLYLTKPFDPPRLKRNIDVFFETTPPRRRSKTYDLDTLKEVEKTGAEPVSPGSSEFDVSSFDTNADVELPTIETKETGARGLPRIMVVDDDDEIIEMMRLTLDGVAEVTKASDAIRAIERLVKFQPDILIIDIMLPKMNGFQLCQSLRSNRAFAKMPILICSAKSSERDIQFAKRVGANDYLTKPFSPNDLINKIKEMQKLPGFRVRPKTYAIHQIQDMERPPEDPFKEEEDVKDQGMRSKKKGMEKIENFLEKEKRGEFEKKEEEPEKKKKRRLFGFGGGK